MEIDLKNENQCCPPFDSTNWDDKIIDWQNKNFVKDKVCTFFYMPLNFGKVITRLMKLVETNNAKTPENLCLSDCTSKWNMDLFLAVDKNIENGNNLQLSGKYYSRVYEGNFNETAKWTKDFEKNTAEKNLQIEKHYMWYTTCPKCAKKYGKNYVVFIAKIKE